MKKTVIVLIVMFLIGFTKANPITSPPVISEFYLINDSTWFIELVFPSGFYNDSTLDGYRITTSTGTFYFKNGIYIIFDSTMVITQDSLQSLLHINRNGDFIVITDTIGYSFDQIYFGNISGSQISAPLIGQSIVNLAYSCYGPYPGWTIEYHLVKDINPTIGYNPFQPSSANGTFTGFVFDNIHNPVTGIFIGISQCCGAPSYQCCNFFNSTLSDSTGSFTKQEYSGRYIVELFFQSSLVLTDSLINIEPDSINYFEFIIDTLLSDIYLNPFQTNISLSCYPNPSTGETTISFEIPAGGHYTKSLIKIYNSNSEIVCILPVNTYNSENKYSIKWDGLSSGNFVTSGIYYCNLELDGRKIATNKLIIVK
ncbi:MAG: T9SS type A sorting domain-containing protein [Bacteroidota bacterium]